MSRFANGTRPSCLFTGRGRNSPPALERHALGPVTCRFQALMPQANHRFTIASDVSRPSWMYSWRTFGLTVM